jgi:hypothetical protein
MFTEYNLITTLPALMLIVLMHIFYVPLSRRLDKYWPHWATAAGGFAVGYVFLLLLPKLTLLANKGMSKTPDNPMLGLSLLYLSVLMGFVCYWIIDVLSSDKRRDKTYWRRIQTTSFFFYSVLIGEMVMADLSFLPLAYAISIASLLFHLAGMNHLFHHWHPAFFQSKMRWMMAIGTTIGALGGYLNLFDAKVIGFMTAFMGGSILINVVFYEMPRGGNAKPLPFLGGIFSFAVIIITLRLMTAS